MILALKSRIFEANPGVEGKDIPGRGNIANKGRRQENLPCLGNGKQFDEEREPIFVLVLFLSTQETVGHLESNPHLTGLGLAFIKLDYPQLLQKDCR